MFYFVKSISSIIGAKLNFFANKPLKVLFVFTNNNIFNNSDFLMQPHIFFIQGQNGILK